MDKQDAINLLGGTPKKAAEAMGYKTPHAIYAWPDVLGQAMIDKVRGASLRLKIKPKSQKAPAQSA
jgi:hypothetical protein